MRRVRYSGLGYKMDGTRRYNILKDIVFHCFDSIEKNDK